MWPWATVASSRYWSRVFIFWVPGDYRTIWVTDGDAVLARDCVRCKSRSFRAGILVGCLQDDRQTQGKRQTANRKPQGQRDGRIKRAGGTPALRNCSRAVG